MGFRRWLITLLLFFSIIVPLQKSSGAQLKVDWEVLATLKLEKELLDIVLSFDGQVAYILTKGAVVIYSVPENRVTERIPVDEDIGSLRVSPRGDLIYLINAKSKELSVIQLGFAVEIERGNSISLGPEDAPVALVAFMDFQCPFCSKFFSILRNVLDQFPDKVNLVFKHFPAKDHIYAEKAALASLAAYKQGKFLEIAGNFFQNYNKFEDNTIEQAAKHVGLDMALFKKEMKSESVKRILAEDIEMGRRVMIPGVPAVFINGKKVNNRFLPDLPEMVGRELNKPARKNPGREGP